MIKKMKITNNAQSSQISSKLDIAIVLMLVIATVLIFLAAILGVYDMQQTLGLSAALESGWRLLVGVGFLMAVSSAFLRSMLRRRKSKKISAEEGEQRGSEITKTETKDEWFLEMFIIFLPIYILFLMSGD